MVKPENLIVEGTVFVVREINNETYVEIRRLIIDFMRAQQYTPDNPRSIFINRFLTLTFYRNLPEKDLSITKKIKKLLGLISEESYEFDKHFKSMMFTRANTPYKIDFNIKTGEFNEATGFRIDIRSTPTFIYQVEQLQVKKYLDDWNYNSIILENKQFINKCMTVLRGYIIKEPESIAEYEVTKTIEKLEYFGYNEISNLLERGRKKIEKGNTEDGLTDLRESLTHFLAKLVESKELQAKRKIKQDLKILYDLGYIDGKMNDFIKKGLCNWIYAYLSAKPVHRREIIGYDDALFIFTISEDIISYLIDKVILGR